MSRVPSRNQDRALLALTAVAVLTGIWLRAQHLGEPAELSWDEHHFVRTAENLLRGQRDWNDHPPLGKLLILAGIRGFGDGAFGWRFSALVSGVLNIGLAAALALRAFRNFRAAELAASFVALDGFFIAYSRTALLDGWVATFVLAVAAVITRPRHAWQIWFGALLLGLGCAVKFNVVVMLLPLVWTAVCPRLPRHSLLGIAAAPIAYFAVYSYGLELQQLPHGPSDVWAATRELWDHHAKLTDRTHVLVSDWYTWLLPQKPVAIRFSEVDGIVRSMSSMGNPLLWWAVSLSVLSLVFSLISWVFLRGRSFVGARPAPLATLGAFDPGELWVFCLWALPIVPWIVSRRDSYIYHYLPAYGFGVVLVAGKLAGELERLRRRAWLVVGAIVAAGFWVAPVNAELPVTRLGYELRLWFPGWRKASPKPRIPNPVEVPSARTR